MSFESRLQRRWYGTPGWLLALLPLEFLFRSLTAIRRVLFRLRILHSEKIAAPVVVIGNISVGGTGKTPIVVALCAALKKAGYQPGIISRGYGARPPQWPYVVTPQSRANEAGDEPLLIAAETDNGNVVRHFHGELEDAAIWDRALSGDEVKVLSMR